MSATLRIARLAAQDRAMSTRWDEFVLAHPQATFFHRSGWLRVIEGVFGHRGFFMYAERDGVIEGVLPLAEVKSRLFGHAVTSLPFAVYGGVAALNDEAAVALEAEAEKIARGQGAQHLEYRNLGPTRHADWPRQDLYVTFRKAILPDEEANMLAIPRKQRAMVRKGIKNELRAEIDAGVDRFFDLYADNVHRHGTPAMPKKY
ncbi:peptidoglycan bridge formation protein FemAB, partial [Pelomonas sp. HMWF004]